jgi:negative regulator of replication initiation
MKTIAVKVTDELHQLFKSWCVTHGESITAILLRLIKQLLESKNDVEIR